MRAEQKLQHSKAILGLQNTLQFLRPERKCLSLVIVFVLGILGYLIGKKTRNKNK